MDDKIKHIVLLLLENQSFDRLLGCFSQQADVDGIRSPGQPAYSNRDSAGQVYEQKPTDTKQVNPDPKHEARFVLEQLTNSNSGFVLDFERSYPSSTTAQRQEVMGYHPLGFLPALHTLAGSFTICDHWYSSLPGPTWPNRFFALTGTCHGQALMPEGWEDPQLATYFDQTQDTIFDRLNEAHRTWRVYYYDFPSSLLLTHQRDPRNLIHYHRIDEFFQDCGNEAEFPDFAFIEPKYFGADQNDDHPPHNITKGEKLIADVYNAIRSNPILWDTTLLVVTFDEHGGFYDHVSPPTVVPPDNLPARIDPNDPSVLFRFDRLGVRVPAVLVSPWVAKRVEKTPFDHTSLLRYLVDKWHMGGLGQRTASANPISVAIQNERRDDTPSFIRVPYTDLIPPDPALEREDSSNHHKALLAFAYALAKETGRADLISLVGAQPGAWAQMKARLGKFMLSAGTRLASDVQLLHHQQVDATMQIVDGIIKSARVSS